MYPGGIANYSLLEIPDVVLRLGLCLTSVWQLFTDPQGCEVFLVLRGALGCFTQNLKVYLIGARIFLRIAS